MPLLTGGSGPQSNTWFFGPNRVSSANGISISSVVFFCSAYERYQRTNRQTDRQNDHATLVSTAMAAITSYRCDEA